MTGHTAPFIFPLPEPHSRHDRRFKAADERVKAEEAKAKKGEAVPQVWLEVTRQGSS